MSNEHNSKESSAEHVSLPAPPRTLKIGQVNILGNKFGTDYRYRFLTKKATDEALDILTVQEVSDEEALQASLSESGLSGGVFSDIYAKKRGHYPYPLNDSVGVVFNPDSLYEKGIYFQNYCVIDFSWLGVLDGVLTRFRDTKTTPSPSNAHDGDNQTTNPSSIYVFSGHFAWNMANEYKRMIQLRLLASLAEYLHQHDPTSIFLISSDVNTNDDTASYDYIVGRTPGIEIPVDMQPKYYASLTGAAEAILSGRNYGDRPRTEGPDKERTDHLLFIPEAQGTFFVDAYDFANNEDKTTLWATTDHGQANNKWAMKTVKRLNLTYPSMLPKRRVDYIFSYGWVYGKRGCPISYHRFGEPEPASDFDEHMSDHYGVSSRILL